MIFPEKTKYTDELKEIQEKFDCQNNKVTELESELNKKNKNIDTLKNNIKDLKNENCEIFIKRSKNFEIINKKHSQEIEKIERELKKMKNISMIMKKIQLKNKKKLIN